eukprot:TRINITY_DN242_c1_g1_i3.p1 TRINITY_DN242_c1_g1~~TRINITY_DN242_c1_g1_i3.p1  ORF type:complete len:659 (-),score=34.20 TRINITY_DN242_c1_g1_i3:2028-3743(-)
MQLQILFILYYFVHYQLVGSQTTDRLNPQLKSCVEAQEECEIQCNGKSMEFSCEDADGFSSQCACSNESNLGNTNSRQDILAQIQAALVSACETAQSECFDECGGHASFSCNGSGAGIEKNCKCLEENTEDGNITPSSQASGKLNTSLPLSPSLQVEARSSSPRPVPKPSPKMSPRLVSNPTPAASRRTSSQSSPQLSPKPVSNSSPQPIRLTSPRPAPRPNPTPRSSPQPAPRPSPQAASGNSPTPPSVTFTSCEEARLVCDNKCNNYANFKCSSSQNKVTQTCECVEGVTRVLASPQLQSNGSEQPEVVYTDDSENMPEKCAEAQQRCYDDCDGTPTFECRDSGNTQTSRCRCTQGINLAQLQPMTISSQPMANSQIRSLLPAPTTVQVPLVAQATANTPQNQVRQSNSVDGEQIQVQNVDINPSEESASSSEDVTQNISPAFQTNTSKASIAQQTSSFNSSQNANSNSNLNRDEVKIINVKVGSLRNCPDNCEWKMDDLPPKIIDTKQVTNSTEVQAEVVKAGNIELSQDDECQIAREECTEQCAPNYPIFVCTPFLNFVIKSCTCGA